MAKEIILLDVLPNDLGDTFVRYAFWFTIPPANQVPIPGATSQWRQATATDNQNLATGAVIEEVRAVTFLQGMTLAQMKTYLQAAYANRLAVRNAAPNPNAYYGAYWDGTTWIGV